MDYVQLLGLSAAVITSVSNIPQALKIIRTKETKGVSTRSYTLLLVGLLFWIGYGIQRNDLPIILSNALSAIICGSVLFLKLTSKKVLEDLHDKIWQD